MKAIVLHAKNDLRYEDVADVSITKSTQVLVKMLYGGICGSDKHYYSLGANGSFEVKHPFVLGHEGSGIVEEVGAVRISDLLSSLADAAFRGPGFPGRPDRRRAVSALRGKLESAGDGKRKV